MKQLTKEQAEKISYSWASEPYYNAIDGGYLEDMKGTKYGKALEDFQRADEALENAISEMESDFNLDRPEV